MIVALRCRRSRPLKVLLRRHFSVLSSVFVQNYKKRELVDELMRGFSRGLIGVFFVLVLLIPCVSAATAPVRDSSLYEYDTLVLQLKLASAISLVQNGPSPSVESVDAELSWFPRESYRQTVQSITTRPFAKQEDDFLLYHWTGPRLGNLDYSLDATVTTSASAFFRMDSSTT